MTDIQLKEHHDLAMACYEKRKTLLNSLAGLKKIRSQLNDLSSGKNLGKLTDNIIGMKDQLKVFEGSAGTKGNTLGYCSSAYERIFSIIQDSDSPVTEQTKTAILETEPNYKQAIADWDFFVVKSIPLMNVQLNKAGLQLLKL